MNFRRVNCLNGSSAERFYEDGFCEKFKHHGISNEETVYAVNKNRKECALWNDVIYKIGQKIHW